MLSKLSVLTITFEEFYEILHEYICGPLPKLQKQLNSEGSASRGKSVGKIRRRCAIFLLQEMYKKTFGLENIGHGHKCTKFAKSPLCGEY